MASDTVTHGPEISATHLGFRKEYRKEIADKLNAIIASCYILTLKTQYFHWVVQGFHFYSLHKLSEEHYEYLLQTIDTLAERLRALGENPLHQFSMMLQKTHISEFQSSLKCQDMLAQLLADHETLSQLCHKTVHTAEENDDIVTADLLTDLATFHEKAGWMLRSTLA